MTTFSVEGQKFLTVQTACMNAKRYAEQNYTIDDIVAVVDDERNVVVAVVTDDANGLTIHRLATWREEWECAY